MYIEILCEKQDEIDILYIKQSLNDISNYDRSHSENKIFYNLSNKIETISFQKLSFSYHIV